MQDGKGALYFVNATKYSGEIFQSDLCGDGSSSPTSPFIKPQATPKTRQQMRDDSPSGQVDMDPWLGRSFDALTITLVALAALSISYLIDFSLM